MMKNCGTSKMVCAVFALGVEGVEEVITENVGELRLAKWWGFGQVEGKSVTLDIKDETHFENETTKAQYTKNNMGFQDKTGKATDILKIKKTKKDTDPIISFSDGYNKDGFTSKQNAVLVWDLPRVGGLREKGITHAYDAAKTLTDKAKSARFFGQWYVESFLCSGTAEEFKNSAGEPNIQDLKKIMTDCQDRKKKKEAEAKAKAEAQAKAKAKAEAKAKAVAEKEAEAQVTLHANRAARREKQKQGLLNAEAQAKAVVREKKKKEAQVKAQTKAVAEKQQQENKEKQQKNKERQEKKSGSPEEHPGHFTAREQEFRDNVWDRWLHHFNFRDELKEDKQVKLRKTALELLEEVRKTETELGKASEVSEVSEPTKVQYTNRLKDLLAVLKKFDTSDPENVKFISHVHKTIEEQKKAPTKTRKFEQWELRKELKKSFLKELQKIRKELKKISSKKMKSN